jgi:serine/threonine protein kinase
MSVPSGALRAGVLLHKKYRLERVLGSGGMGVVWAAERVDDRAHVAVKVLAPGRAHDERDVRRFLREGRATAKLQGEHVARVFDVGTLDDGTPFLVMELLDGTSLLRHLRSRGPLPAAECAAWVMQACEALGEAHALGIVHRDLKPDNLLLVDRPDGSRLLKVLDFGIAKRLAGGATTGGPSASWSFDTTGDGSPVGSPSYMAPEQISDPSKVDARADIWSLGVIAFELLAGQRPFDGASLPETISRVLKASPPPLLELRPGLPAGLASIVECCLEKDRERRFRTVGALAQALSHFARPAEAPARGGLGPAPAAAPTLGQATLNTLVASHELIYGTQGELQAPGPPSSQLETLGAPTLRDPPRFDTVTGEPIALPPIVGLPAAPAPAPGEGVVLTPPVAAIRGDVLAQVQNTVRLVSDQPPPPPGGFSHQPGPFHHQPGGRPTGPPTPLPTPVLITPPPRATRRSTPPPQAPRKFDAALTVVIVFIASFGSALLTMTLARKCSSAGTAPPAAPSAGAQPAPSAKATGP